MNVTESRQKFLAMRPMLEEAGICWQLGAEPYGFVSSDPAKGCSPAMAMDALPTLITDPNAGIPSMFTMWVDPDVFRVVFSPLRAVEIIGPERRVGDWTMQTAMFPIEEPIGETTAYGDYNNSGENTANVNFPQRQAFLYQAIIEYGDLEVARFAAAKINMVAAKQRSRVRQLNTFQNFSYFYGIAQLQNYGLVNDPNLPASISPAPKAYGGTTWLSGNQVKATANEIYGDLLALYIQLVAQNAGVVNRESELVFVMDPQHEAALATTNSFGNNVTDLLKKNFPNHKVVSAVQYGPVSATQPQGQPSGLSLIQLICPEVEGQRTMFPAFNERLRTHRVVYDMSAARQKCTSGTFGTVIRYAAGVASMAGV